MILFYIILYHFFLAVAYFLAGYLDVLFEVYFLSYLSDFKNFPPLLVFN